MSETGWQTLTQELHEATERLRISGGWLYRTILFDDDGDPVATALAILPESAA